MFDFRKGDIIEFCGETFEVINNWGSSGEVKENCSAGAYIGRFYWEYAGEKCKLIKRA